MKKTLILCILSAVLAAGITHLMEKDKKPGTEDTDAKISPLETLDTAQLKRNDFRSRAISLDLARKSIDSLRKSSDFVIPTSWLFDATQIAGALGLGSSPNAKPSYLRLYSGIRLDSNEKDPSLTLIAVACEGTDTSDIFRAGVDESGIYEFADPCPPKCAASNDLKKMIVPADASILHKVKRNQ